MKLPCIGAILAFLFCLPSGTSAAAAAAAADTEQVLRGLAAVAPALLIPQRMEVLGNAASTIVNHADVKGEFGEALARSQRILGLEPGSAYVSVTPRTGRQGIDVLLLEVDRRGNPMGSAVVVESKFARRTPRLKLTMDGFQGSSRWVDARLRSAAGSLGSIAASGESWVRVGDPMPAKGVPLRIPGGQRGWVCVDGGAVTTNFSDAEIPAARQAAALQAKAIRDAMGNGRVVTMLMHARPQDGGYAVTVSDISRELDPGSPPIVGRLPVRSSILLPTDDLEVARASIDAISKELRKQSPHLAAAECRQLARVVLDQGKAFHDSVEMSRMQQWRATSALVGMAAAVPMVFGAGEGLFEMLRGQGVDWSELAYRSAQGSAAAALGAGSGIFVTSLAVEQPTIGRAISRTGRLFGVGSIASFRVAGGVTGGAAASTALAGLQFATGGINGDEALAVGGVGVASSVIVGAAEMAVLSSVGAFASASTGTAIGSLSGASATSASLAWLGGGSAAAGGLGVAGGFVVLTAGGAVIAIAAGEALWLAYESWKVGADLREHLATLHYLGSDWQRVIDAAPAQREAVLSRVRFIDDR